jgi:hypothetical protein
VEIWVDLLQRRDGVDEADARVMAHAAFGLLNSTPYSLKALGRRAPGLAVSTSGPVRRSGVRCGRESRTPRRRRSR